MRSLLPNPRKNVCFSALARRFAHSPDTIFDSLPLFPIRKFRSKPTTDFFDYTGYSVRVRRRLDVRLFVGSFRPSLYRFVLPSEIYLRDFWYPKLDSMTTASSESCQRNRHVLPIH